MCSLLFKRKFRTKEKTAMKTEQRLILALLFCIALVVGVQTSAYAQTIASGTCGKNLAWTLDDAGTLSISGTGDMIDYIYSDAPWYEIRDHIASIIIQPGVTSIGDEAFPNCDNLTSVRIPNSVSYIGQDSFGDCDSLTEVIIPEGVTTIGSYAFQACDNLLKVLIPKSLINFNEGTFFCCDSLTSAGPAGSGCSIEFGWKDFIPSKAFYACNITSVIIPNSLTNIGDLSFYCCPLTNAIIPGNIDHIGFRAFSRCFSLTSVTFQEGVKVISGDAFENCESLTGVVIPNSVTLIGSGAFADCINLNTISVSSDNSSYCDIDGVLFSKDRTMIHTFPAGKSGEYSIPDSVSNIGFYAFKGCSSLTNVTISKNVTSIGQGVFSGCSDLLSVTIPANLTKIPQNTFCGCSSLTNITIPEGVTTIDQSAFQSCSSLNTVTIPASVNRIGDHAFSNCRRLKYVYYGGIQEQWNAISMGFNNAALTSAIVYMTTPDFILPKAVSEIDESAFSGNAFTFAKLSDKTKYIGSCAFAGCPNLAYISIPNAEVVIDENAFGNMQNLTILGKTGSTAETYATAHGYTFIAVS